MFRIDPTALHLAREFRQQPVGRRSAGLEQVLNLLRSGPVKGKYCLVCIEPYRRWMLAQISGERGVPPLLHENRIFTSLEDAEWEIFKLRWQETTGHELRDEDI
jgi:hypothetical protein